MVRRGSGWACNTESAHVLFLSAVKGVPHLLLAVHRDAVSDQLRQYFIPALTRSATWPKLRPQTHHRIDSRNPSRGVKIASVDAFHCNTESTPCSTAGSLPLTVRAPRVMLTLVS
eukprot:5792-Heterococcus_DN1.PRE.2